MDSQILERLQEVWDQTKIPVISNKGKGVPLRVQLPEGVDGYNWIKKGRRNLPKWVKQYRYWKAPYAWLKILTQEALDEFGKVYLIQSFQSQEKCARVCKEATGYDCDCSCAGEYHGSNNMDGWVEISDTFATQWTTPRKGFRLLVKKPHTQRHELILAAAIMV